MNDIDQLLHDVRNPLNNIAINAELAKMVLEKSGSSERIASALDKILQECASCSQVLDQFKQE